VDHLKHKRKDLCGVQADPPGVVVGTIACICKMIEIKKLKLNAVNTIVIDEVKLSSAWQNKIHQLLSVLSV
jgi:superfamily II DNA or RNA helicase